MARPPITVRPENTLFREQLDAALDYVEGLSGGATDLTYTAATRVIASSTGTDATLPLVTSGDAGLAPASGGGTTNFLRADATWAAPTATVADGDKGDITVSASGATWTIDNGAVTLAKMADIATDRLIGRDTAGTGVPEALTVGGGVEFSGSGGIQRSALTGAVTASAGSGTTSLGSFTLAALNTAVSDDNLVPVSGATMTGLLTTAAPSATTAYFNLTPAANNPSGAADGDMWVHTTEGLKCRVNGTTYSAAFLNGASTFTGKKTFTASTSGGAFLNIAHGTAPSSPADGDVWTTTTSMYARINGSTVDLGASGGGVSDGDKGDITVSGSGATWTIDNAAVSYAKIQDVSAASRILGRGSAGGSGDVEELTVGDGLTIETTTLRPNEYYIIQAADRTLTNTGSAQKIFDQTTNGSISLPTGTYVWEQIIHVTGMSGTSGNAAINLLGAGTATIGTSPNAIAQHTGIDNSTPTGPNTITGSLAVDYLGPASAATAGTGTGLSLRSEGLFRVTSAGTIIPSITLVTGIAATLKAGSYFYCRRIGGSTDYHKGGWT